MGEKIIDKLIEFIRENYTIESDLYEHFNVKRGLRNSDGTGVLVGLTSIGEVRGYIKSLGPVSAKTGMVLRKQSF